MNPITANTLKPLDLDIALASSSPRRQQLLVLADIPFTTLAVAVDESIAPLEMPQDYIVRMVAIKADAACNMIVEQSKLPASEIENVHEGQEKASNHQEIAGKGLTLVITADTIGVLPDGKSILIKPVDKADAFTMWSKMSANTHQVWTAVQLTLIDSLGAAVQTKTLLEKTEVTFIPLTVESMAAYWQSGEPQDKAGGYAIQGKGACWVDRINGSYSNVVGLPLSQTLIAIDELCKYVVDD